MLEARNISKAFPGIKALDDVSLLVRPGVVHAVVGENGAGKSTLMKILSGVYTNYSGQILLDGKPVVFKSPRAAEAAGIASIYQELNLVPALSVAENIFLGRLHARLGFVDYQRLHHGAAELLAGLGRNLDPRRPVSHLKVATQQVVEIAKALSLKPRLLIMDEPTSALGADDAEKLFQVIRRLVRAGTAVIYISHKMDELFKIADEFTVLRDGKLVGHKAADATAPNELVRMMVGREIDEFARPAKTEENVESLRVENLSSVGSTRTGRRTLSQINFTVYNGEILGIGGLLGSGRTELLESLFGLHPVAAASRICIQGQAVSITNPIEAIRAGLALVTEDRKALGLILNMGVGENITLARLRAFTRFLFVNRRAQAAAARASVDRLRIRTAALTTPVAHLSGGNQQKVVLAKCLLTAPKILLLDEPTKGIDVAAKAEIYRMIQDLAATGITILMVSSELPELLKLSDRILVIREGAVAGILPRSAATEEGIIQLAVIP